MRIPRLTPEELGLELHLDMPEFGIRVYKTPGETIARMYLGKSSKPQWAYRFKSETQMFDFITSEVEKVVKRKLTKLDAKADEKARIENEFKEVKVGDIFCCSWGYEQTNVDFYKLINLKGKKGTFIRVGYNTIEETSWCSSNIQCDPEDEFGETFTKLIQGKRFKVSSYSSAYKMENPKALCNKSWGY